MKKLGWMPSASWETIGHKSWAIDFGPQKLALELGLHWVSTMDRRQDIGWLRNWVGGGLENKNNLLNKWAQLQDTINL